MKKTYMLFAFLALVLASNAQSISRQAISNTGGTLTGGGNQITFTLGQTLTPSLSGGASKITNGFQQPGEQLKINAVPASLCPGASFSVPYDAIDIGGGNTFTLQLSDATGNFAGAVNIGSVTGNAPGTISAVIPPNTPTGNGYRIRIVSSFPETESEDNGTNIVINTNLAPVVTGSPNFCQGGSTTLVAAGGFSSYLWTGGATTASLAVNAIGTYTVTVTNSLGCTGTASVAAAVTQIAPNAVTSQVSCKGGSNGVISLNPSGGTGSYVYQWNNGSTLQNITGLNSGTYSVLITDGQGCTKTASFNISQPATNLLINSTKVNVRCHGNAIGTATVIPTGGVHPYTYLWSNFKTTSTITGVSAGVYTCTVTDAAGCSKTTVITITQPPAYIALQSQSNVTFPGGNNGSAQVLVSGGTAPYSYNWNTNPAGTNSAVSGLVAGLYKCTISDDKGCQLKVSFTITEPFSKPASTGKAKEMHVKVYPNPSEGFVVIEQNVAEKGDYTITILDRLNRVVLEKSATYEPGSNINEYDLRVLPKGMYSIQIQSEQETGIYKIVLQ